MLTLVRMACIDFMCFHLAMFRFPEAVKAAGLRSCCPNTSRSEPSQGNRRHSTLVLPTRKKYKGGMLGTTHNLGMLTYKVVCAALWDGERASGVLLTIYSNPMVPIFVREALVWEVLYFKKQAPAK